MQRGGIFVRLSTDGDDVMLKAAVRLHVHRVLYRVGGDRESAAELLGIPIKELNHHLGD